MTELAHYRLNTPWSLPASFAVGTTPTDPATLAATVRKPNGLLLEYAFPGANIAKTGTGEFVISGTATLAGVWYVEVVGTGAAAAQERHSFVVDPRWPSDLLEPHALCSIEDVELVLDRLGDQGSSGQEADDKRWIATLVNSISRLVLDYTGREFLPVTDDTQPDVARYFNYECNGVLVLAPYEARAISAVALHTQLPTSSELTLADTYSETGQGVYRAEQLSTEATILRLELPELAIRRRWTQVRVTGKWGAGIVPQTVALLVASEAANAYLRATRSGEVKLEGPDVGAHDLSQDAATVLAPFVNEESF